MATSSRLIHALTVPTGTRRYSAISSCVRPSMIASEQTRAALWLELIEHDPKRDTVRNVRCRVRDGLLSLANGGERFILER